MGLYPVKLKNVKSLEREKSRLLKEQRKLEEGGIFAIGAGMGKGSGKKKKSDTTDTASGLLSVVGPVISQVMEMLVKRMSAPVEKPAKNAAIKPEEKPRNLVKSIAWEFISGYLKWKAIELSIKGIRHLLRRKPDAQKV